MTYRLLIAFAALSGVAAPATAQRAANSYPSRAASLPAFAPTATPAPRVTTTIGDAPAPAIQPPQAQALPTTPSVPSPVTSAPSSGYIPTPAMLGLPCTGEQCATPTACSTCDCLCGPPGKFWVSAEYIAWVASGQNLPPLVTASPPGTIRDNAGVLGAPGTTTLFGGGRYNNDWRSGLRIRAGMWFDECQRFGIEGDFFFLGQSRDTFTAASDGSQIISRPFFNVLENNPDSQLVSFPGTNDAQLVGFPGVLAGSVGVDATSNFIGGGINTICNICCDPCGRLDLLLGFQYLNLRDQVTITENLTALEGSNVPAGTRFLIRDDFKTSNNFYGGVIGFNYERRFGHYFLGIRPSVALGVTHTTVDINGSTQIIDPNGNSQVFPGGLLTQTSNIGHYESNQFSVVPQIGIRAGVQVTNNLRAFVSYNYIYWNNVARAGDQIDLRVNPNQIAPPQLPLSGPAFPAFQLRRSGYSVQGIGAGLEYRF